MQDAQCPKTMDGTASAHRHRLAARHGVHIDVRDSVLNSLEAGKLDSYCSVYWSKRGGVVLTHQFSCEPQHKNDDRELANRCLNVPDKGRCVQSVAVIGS